MTRNEEHLANIRMHLLMFEQIQTLCGFSQSALAKEMRSHRDKCVDDPYPKGLISTTQFTLSRPSIPIVDSLDDYPEIYKQINVHTMTHPEGWTWVAISEGSNTSPENMEDADWALVTKDPSPKYFMEAWTDIVFDHLKGQFNELHPQDFLKNARPERPFGTIGNVRASALDSVPCKIDLDMIVESSPNHFGKPAKPEVRMPSADQDNGPSGPGR